MKNIALLVSCSLFSAFLAIFVYRQLVDPQQIVVKETMATPTYTNLSEDDILFSGKLQRTFTSSTPTDFSKAATMSMPAVVYIRARSEGSFKSGRSQATSGSGVLISENGFIVTNNHVLEGGGKIEVTLHNNDEYEAEIMGTDSNTDLALIKIEARGLPFLIFGNSDSILIGEWVMAVGNPFGLQSTVTAGIVSATGRNIDILREQYAIESFIQTDAAVNAGNSGGALINTEGELVGINTAIMTYTGRYEGYSFAVPANLARKIVYDLREYGSVQRGLLGVSIWDIDKRLAITMGKESVSELSEELGLSSNNGIYVRDVNENSGAKDAGLQAGDVIVGVNGQSTKSISDLQEQIGRMSPGDEVELTFVRKKKRNTVKVILKNVNNSTEIEKVLNDPVLLSSGFEVRDLNESEKRKLKLDGLRVVSIYEGSAVQKTNMEPGFIITHLNGSSISSAREFVNALRKIHGEVELDGRYDFTEEPYSYRFWKN